MLGVTGLFDPLGLYQKDTALRSGKTRGPMIVANVVFPIAEFGLKCPTPLQRLVECQLICVIQPTTCGQTLGQTCHCQPFGAQ